MELHVCGLNGCGHFQLHKQFWPIQWVLKLPHLVKLNGHDESHILTSQVPETGVSQDAKVIGSQYEDSHFL